MKNCFYILPFLLLPIFGLAQENIKEKPVKKETSFKNQIDMDIEVLAFSFGYKRRLYKNWFLGPSFGVGPQASFIYVGSVSDREPSFGIGLTGVMHVSLVAKMQNIKSKWSYEIESRYNAAYISGENGFYALSTGIGVCYGRKVQLGVRASGGRMYGQRKPIYMAGNIILRINPKW